MEKKVEQSESHYKVAEAELIWEHGLHFDPYQSDDYVVASSLCKTIFADTIVKQQGCNGVDDNCDSDVDDCGEDRSPPTILMSEGVTVTELPAHPGKAFVTSHCFDSSEDVKIFLQQNVYAEDDCALDLLISFDEILTSNHGWATNHKFTLSEYVVTATDSRCGVGENWSVRKTFLVEVFDEYDQDVKHQGCNGIDENCDGVADDCSEDRSPPIIAFKEESETDAMRKIFLNRDDLLQEIIWIN